MKKVWMADKLCLSFLCPSHPQGGSVQRHGWPAGWGWMEGAGLQVCNHRWLLDVHAEGWTRETATWTLQVCLLPSHCRFRMSVLCQHLLLYNHLFRKHSSRDFQLNSFDDLNKHSFAVKNFSQHNLPVCIVIIISKSILIRQFHSWADHVKVNK